MSTDVQAARQAVERVRVAAGDECGPKRLILVVDCDAALEALDDAEALRHKADMLAAGGLRVAQHTLRAAADRTVARVIAWALRHGGAS